MLYFIDNEAKKALLSKDNWIDYVVTQINLMKI